MTLSSLLQNPLPFVQQAKAGKVFIYPTDTIYGIGSILDQRAVANIDAFKQRTPGKQYSVIAPGFDWIRAHCQVSDDIEDERKERSIKAKDLGYGGITLLLPKRIPDSFPLASNNKLLGVRIIEHPMYQLIQELGAPFITTSVNLSGEPPLVDPEYLEDPQNLVDVLIDNGIAPNQKSSLVINYQTKELLRT